MFSQRTFHIPLHSLDGGSCLGSCLSLISLQSSPLRRFDKQLTQLSSQNFIQNFKHCFQVLPELRCGEVNGGFYMLHCNARTRQGHLAVTLLRPRFCLLEFASHLTLLRGRAKFQLRQVDVLQVLSQDFKWEQFVIHLLRCEGNNLAEWLTKLCPYCECTYICIRLSVSCDRSVVGHPYW